MPAATKTKEKPSESKALAVRQPSAEAAGFMPVLTIQDAIARWNLMVELTRQVMHAGTDYGKIPGTDKNTLLKPGAEKLCSMFGLSVEDPEIVEKVEDWTGQEHGGEPFFYYLVRQRLTRGGVTVASQLGSCNSWEKKYRYRAANRKCPQCGAESIYLAKDRPEFYCWAKKGGCGAKFSSQDERITSQPAGRVANPEIADTVNTLVKMAQKRAYVSAVLLATNASEFFTVDAEEIIDAEYEVHSPADSPPPQQPAPQPQKAAAQKTAPKKAAELPSSGKELLERLSAYDDKLARTGVISRGELLDAVRFWGARNKLGDDIKAFPAEAFADVAEEVKTFEAEARKAKQPAAQ